MTIDSSTRIRIGALPEVSSVGLGAWSIGGAGWAYDGGAERDEMSVETILYACARGLTWVDTAPTYGQGHSEELVGIASRRLGSDRPLIFTKCGRHWDSPASKPYSDLRPSALDADCETSLRRLGVEVIDLLQIHWPESPLRTPIEESWARMRRMVAQGKIRAAGVSNFGLDLLERCDAVGHIDAVQIPFSMVVRGAASALMQWCADHQTAVLAYSPMLIGLLTDTFTTELIEGMHPDDWRRRHPEFQSPRVERNLDLRDHLSEVARGRSTTVAAVALAWVLSWPQVTGAVAGASKPGQVDGWIQGGSISLTGAELDLIADAIRGSGAGSGPVRPPQERTTST
jgi:aryl-alcohol dehydrogenase-like predicted oxidoreductase